MRKIAVVTATRAEFGLLTPLIRRILSDDELQLKLLVTGMHLSSEYGNTVNEILKAEFPISCRIPIIDNDNGAYGVSLTMANAIKGFAECFREDRPDMVVILGDRTEMLGVASAAMNERIPIAHIHGGEITKGAVDDCVRHAITKMSYLHFTCTDVYRNRVIQMGEDPARVFNVGSLGTENVICTELFTRKEFSRQIPLIPADPAKYAVVTFHPITLDADPVEKQLSELLEAMDECSDIFYLITAANADAGGKMANEVLRPYCSSHDNCEFVESLGMKRYLSAVKHAAFVLGNSSSGILEAPVLGTPAVNIGERQSGRLRAETVIDCEPEHISIVAAIQRAKLMEHKPSFLFGDGHTSEKIVEIIRNTFETGIDLMKGFFDFELPGEPTFEYGDRGRGEK